jgi:phosphate transport system ATP-binding protein
MMDQREAKDFSAGQACQPNPKIKVRDLTIHYGKVLVLGNLSLDIQENEILSVIGPANSGKTSFLRSLNRLNDFDPNIRMSGSILLDGRDIYKDIEAEGLRKRVGMIFALPIPLPLSIHDNITYGPRLAGAHDKSVLGRLVEDSLKAAYLWDEVKDRLRSSALKLSGGQQQRLCIARTLALKPEVILFDEPCSGLDPISTAKVEESMMELKKNHTIVLVTNNTKQAARVGTRTAFFLMGELVEIGPTEKIFTSPDDSRTNDYIIGRFG